MKQWGLPLISLIFSAFSALCSIAQLSLYVKYNVNTYARNNGIDIIENPKEMLPLFRLSWKHKNLFWYVRINGDNTYFNLFQCFYMQRWHFLRLNVYKQSLIPFLNILEKRILKENV